MTILEVPCKPYSKKTVHQNTEPALSLGYLPNENPKISKEQTDQLDQIIRKTCQKYFSEKKRLSDLECQKMNQMDFGWFEAYYRVLPFGCGKMTTAHFETESTRALEMCRDVIVRENIKGDRKKNPTLNKDRSIVLGEVSTDLVDVYGPRIKAVSTQPELQKIFSRARAVQPDLVSACTQKGLNTKVIKDSLELLETGGNLIIKYYQNTDKQTVDLLSYLAAVFQKTQVFISDVSLDKCFFVIGTELNKDLYFESNQFLSRVNSESTSCDFESELYSFNRRQYVSVLENLESNEDKIKKWFEDMITCA